MNKSTLYRINENDDGKGTPHRITAAMCVSNFKFAILLNDHNHHLYTPLHCLDVRFCIAPILHSYPDEDEEKENADRTSEKTFRKSQLLTISPFWRFILKISFHLIVLQNGQRYTQIINQIQLNSNANEFMDGFCRMVSPFV